MNLTIQIMNLAKRLLFTLQGRLILAILFSFTLGSFLPEDCISLFFTISLILKGILECLTPFLVMSCMIYTITSLSSEAFIFMVVLATAIFLSNFIASMIGYFGIAIIYPDSTNLGAIAIKETSISPLCSTRVPKILNNDHGLLLGIAIGSLLAIWNDSKINRYADLLRKKIMSLFFHAVVPMLPLTVLGFMLKLNYEGSLEMLFTESIKDILYIFLIIYIYIVFIFLVLSRFSLSRFQFYIKNSLMPYITAATAMSSMVALPFSIKAAEQNSGKTSLASVVIPATVNIHQVVASCFAPSLAMVILLSYGHGLPGIEAYAYFAFAHGVAKFAGAAVPGGAILIVLPLMEQYFCAFSEEMSSIMIAIYLLVDPIISSGNTLANQAFCILIGRIFKRKFK